MKEMMKRALAIGGVCVLLLVLEACSGNSNISTGVGLHRSSSGDWGSSISFGIHSHGRGW